MSLYNYQNCDRCLSPIDTPDNVDSSCSVNSIRQTFLEIINAVKNTEGLNFNVDVEITNKNGVISIVNFSKLNINSIVLSETTLVINDIAFSLCDVVKINVLSSSVLNTTFPATLLNSLKNITTTSYYPNDECYFDCLSCGGCSSSTNIKCAQEMQDYINKNAGSIQTVGYTGGFSKVKDITSVGNISTIDVVEDATINLSTTPVINSASIDSQTIPVIDSATVSSETRSVIDSVSLDIQTTPVIKAITSSETEVVSEVNLNNTSLLSEAVPIFTEVAAPLNATQTAVVSDIILKPEDNFVNNIQTTTQQVVSEVTQTTATAITSIPDGEDIEGVISGVSSPIKATPEPVNIPTLSSTGTGLLTVTIAAGSIDGTNPRNDITLNVKVGDQNIVFSGNVEKFVLPNETNLIGYTEGDPISSTVKQIGTPTMDNFVQSIRTTTEQGIKTVTHQNTTGKLIDIVNQININNVDNPTTKTVVENIQPRSENVNTVTTVDKVTLSDLFRTTTEDVISSATLRTTTEDVVASTTLDTTTENVLSSVNLTTTNKNVLETASLSLNKTTVINGLDETTITVVSPIKEDIDGRIFAAGDGIMAVDNTNGDISVYSICDINTVTS